MRILIDTNILIYREDPTRVPESLQELLRIIGENRHTLLVHPASIEDICNDTDSERREVMMSKLKSYPLLESPPVPTAEFLSCIGDGSGPAEELDNMILCTIYKNAADVLITEDRGILRKAMKLGIEDRVMNMNSAMDYFVGLHKRRRLSHAMIKEVPVYNIDVRDPIFDSLKEEYGKPNFEDWFQRISREGRKCWVCSERNKIKAILIYKEENEPIDTIPPLPKRKRFKIATLKVDIPGQKVGELFLKLAFQYCVDHTFDETYLTHFTKKEDYLVDLISEFGFEAVGMNKREETVYLKKLYPEGEVSPVEMSRRFYPCYKDGTNIKKFIIPILPEFHDRLFQDYRRRQTKITEYVQFNPQGNTIKKAYLTHSRIKAISKGDIVLFYRSQDQEVTSLGVVEDIHLSLTDENEVLRITGKRTIYSYREIQEMVRKPVSVIIFRYHFRLQNPLHLQDLKQKGILKSAPQSIVKISDRGYKHIREKGGIDERFAFS